MQALLNVYLTLLAIGFLVCFNTFQGARNNIKQPTEGNEMSTKFTIQDAAEMVYGFSYPGSGPCMRSENARNNRAEEWNDKYREIINAIPDNWRGSLLLEAVSELAAGETLDDEIIAAYDNRDALEAGRLLFVLLDKQCKVIAERQTNEELNV